MLITNGYNSNPSSLSFNRRLGSAAPTNTIQGNPGPNTVAGSNFSPERSDYSSRSFGPNMKALYDNFAPENMAGQPNNVVGQPNTVAGQPNTVAGQPNNVAGQPNTVVGQPNNVAGQPNTVVGQPNTVVGQPHHHHHKPGAHRHAQPHHHHANPSATGPTMPGQNPGFVLV